ncbi:hypothetical protein VTI28DRAFT_53 [Corynascus sepedonium]
MRGRRSPTLAPSLGTYTNAPMVESLTVINKLHRCISMLPVSSANKPLPRSGGVTQGQTRPETAKTVTWYTPAGLSQPTAGTCL